MIFFWETIKNQKAYKRGILIAITFFLTPNMHLSFVLKWISQIFSNTQILFGSSLNFS